MFDFDLCSVKMLFNMLQTKPGVAMAPQHLRDAGMLHKLEDMGRYQILVLFAILIFWNYHDQIQGLENSVLSNIPNFMLFFDTFHEMQKFFEFFCDSAFWKYFNHSVAMITRFMRYGVNMLCCITLTL